METDQLVWATNFFGGVIKKKREMKKMTQEELAKLCDVSDVYISQIEKGGKIPKLRICRLLANALDLDEKRLLLLAYRSSAPEEIRELLVVRQGSIPLSERCKNLLESLGALPEDKQDEILNFLEAALRLVKGESEIANNK
jgi:transcriptional regulator with XRE-family HTH domain